MNNDKKQLQQDIESLLHEIENEKKYITMQETRLSSSNDPTKKKKYRKEIDQSTKEIESLEDKLITLQKDLNFMNDIENQLGEPKKESDDWMGFLNQMQNEVDKQRPQITKKESDYWMGFLNRMENELGEVEVDKQRPQNTLTPLEIHKKIVKNYEEMQNIDSELPLVKNKNDKKRKDYERKVKELEKQEKEEIDNLNKKKTKLEDENKILMEKLTTTSYHK